MDEVTFLVGLLPDGTEVDIDYCSPNVPHIRLVGLVERAEQYAPRQFAIAIAKYLLTPTNDDRPTIFCILTVRPICIVAACLAALGKLPEGVTLDMVREAGEEEQE